jgi:hypothetical protein
MLKWMLLALLAFVVFIGAAAAAFLLSSPTRPKLPQIQTGRPLAEAKAILGEPDVTMPRGPSGTPLGYSWQVEGGRVFAFVDNAQTVIAADASFNDEGIDLVAELRCLFQW